MAYDPIWAQGGLQSGSRRTEKLTCLSAALDLLSARIRRESADPAIALTLRRRFGGCAAELQALRSEIMARLMSGADPSALALERLHGALGGLAEALAPPEPLAFEPRPASRQAERRALALAERLDSSARLLLLQIKAALVVGAGALALSAQPAAAACSAAADVANCTGNVSGGASYTYPNIDTLLASGILDDVTPPAGTAGFSLSTYGGNGSSGSPFEDGDGGGDAHALSATIDVTPHTIKTSSAPGVLVSSQGGYGGGGGDAGVVASAGNGGGGGSGGAVTINFTGQISTTGANSHGIVALSAGGGGGDGGNFYVGGGSAGSGGAGGAGGNVLVDFHSGSLLTSGERSYGVYAASIGGPGGNAGSCSVAICGSSYGGDAAHGSSVEVDTGAGTLIQTSGNLSDGIHATSIGGFGGNGGDSYFSLSFASNGASAGSGGDVLVNLAGQIDTTGKNANGVFAQSIGGGGGSGGDSSITLVSVGGSGSQGGDGGSVTVNAASTSSISTANDFSRGIFAQSVGGGGGDGGEVAGLISIGGDGSNGSHGGQVSVGNAGIISTGGAFSDAVFAQSVGGGGGSGGGGGGLVTVGGSAGAGAIGGAVTVSNSGGLLTGGTDAYGVFAQSVGGSGGDGGMAGGIVAVGGSGGTGGDGGNVSVSNTGQVTSTGDRSIGVFAQSVGGGGGEGGGAISVGAFLNVSVGGKGGAGGAGGAVDVDSAGQVVTQGQRAAAIFAQSVGGGGGGGGFGAGGSAGAFGDISVGVGGSGGAAGAGGAVGVTAGGVLSTQGADSDGVFAQSVGGGGGTGGFAVAAAFAGGQAAVSGSVAVGGSGGAGGAGGLVTVASSAAIQTGGDRSAGVYAQSVGGGGGAGGWSGAVAGSGGAVAGAIGVSVGGGGAAAGNGGAVTMLADGGDAGVFTGGKDAAGVFAQSIGGGGGTGGFSLAGALAVGKGAGAATVAVGGGGGAGGTGGTVLVNSDVVIGTKGDRSYGVQAQSVGGGGGTGGWAGDITGALSTGVSGSLALALGGGGGAAGAGGQVQLTNSDTVATGGANAHALFAQSVGGGGGSGGFSISGDLSASNGTAIGIGADIGGSGGVGGSGGKVALTNSGLISTTGDRSYGVYAQSVGGGGGDGGWAGDLTGAVSKGESVTLGFTLGGSGGSAGNGGAVTVGSSGDVFTTGADSNAVFAQSVGGGGGTGGLAISAALGLSKSTNLAFGLGGFGGSGGTGGDVGVTTSGEILTKGDGANGVFAQSVGGGGGTGGAAGALTLSGSQSVNLSMNIGGLGGTGSIGGAVTVANQGLILTQGENANGVFAESVGGGGGHGGMAGIDENNWNQYLAGGAGSVSIGSQTENISVALGGTGGTGANAGAVTVNNSGAIYTLGDQSDAIYAHSIGGGGGDAGVATAASGAFGKGQNGTYAIAFGGEGAEAGDGGLVHVTNSGALYTGSDGSAGVFAQSVGGGGGAGGSARGYSLSFSKQAPAKGAAKATSVSISIGGQGGAAGVGGEVRVDNSGSIATQGADSEGVFAQSVGGGGGAGGIVSTQGQEIVNFIALANKGEANGANISIGGSGAGGGAGGLVIVNNTGVISTTGTRSHGVFAQSVGGGGGVGGSGVAGTVSIGGEGGVAGDGGAVNVANSGGIFTQGSMADGIYAQSVGGGGGDGGATDFEGDTYTYRSELAATMVEANNLQNTIELAKSFDEPEYGIEIGGMGGASGNGGAVTVVNNGVISTSGDLAHGVFAQSVGGGGGNGGDGIIGAVGQIAVSGPGGSAGNGGAVSVTNNGTIRTSGFGAYGIYAQSVGGGGGVAGDFSLGIAQWGNLKFTGLSDYSSYAKLSLNPLAGNGGNGGDVTVVNTGDIILTGDGDVGIFAQSVGGGGGQYGSSIGLSFVGSLGGNGTAGQVSVIQNGSIYATGKNGIGAFFQSSATDGQQNIIATLNGNVVGGTVYGMGVLIDGGLDNTINLKGWTYAGSNLAIEATGGDDTINSFVGVIGNVDLGTGTNAFNNLQTSRFITLDYVKLNGGLLTNLGAVEPGGSDVVQTTALTGSYLQGASGQFDFNLDFWKTGKPGEADLLAATGSAQLGGSYVLEPLNPGYALPGSHVVPIITAAGGVSASGLNLVTPPSLIATYSLQTTATALDFDYAIDFAPKNIGLNKNQLAVGAYINAIQTAGSSPTFSPIAAQLFYVADPNVLKSDYSSFGAESYADQIAAAYLATERFTDSMMSCPLSTERFRVRGDSCAWIKATGTWLGLKATASNQGFNQQAAGVAGGYEKSFGEHLKFGYALSAETVTGGAGFRSDASGQRYQGGLVGKGDWGGWGVDLAAAFGTERLHTGRTVFSPAQVFYATGRQKETWESYTVRLSRTWRFNGAYAKPIFEASRTEVHNGALAEHGAGPLSLNAPAQTQGETRISPKLELGAETVIGRFAYRPYVRGGFTRVLNGEEPLFDAAFDSAPAGVGTFPTRAKLDRMTADAEAGVTMVGPGGASARLGWFGQFGKRTREQGLGLKFTLPF